MTNDLVKRLRETTHMYQVDCELKMNCADRIEELEAEVKSMAMDCLVAKGQAADAYQAQLKAEAKLTEVVSFIEFLDENYRHMFGDTARSKIRTLYAELTSSEAATKEGGKDE